MSEICKNPALICKNVECPCLTKLHGKCSFTSIDSVAEKIRSKKRPMREELSLLVDELEKIYDESIDRLSRDRESVQIWRDNYGVNELEYKLVEMLNLNKT